METLKYLFTFLLLSVLLSVQSQIVKEQWSVDSAGIRLDWVPLAQDTISINSHLEFVVSFKDSILTVWQEPREIDYISIANYKLDKAYPTDSYGVQKFLVHQEFTGHKFICVFFKEENKICFTPIGTNPYVYEECYYSIELKYVVFE